MGQLLMLSATDRLSHSMDPIEVNDSALTSHPCISHVDPPGLSCMLLFMPVPLPKLQLVPEP